MSTQTSTKIWQHGPDGAVLLKTVDGLPYGTAPQVFIPDLGQATRTGVQTSGSGAGQAIVAVVYTLS